MKACKQLHLTTTADINTVKIYEINLRECYSCEAGAQLTLNCQIDFGTAMAHVSCPSDIRFPITCNTTGVKRSVRIYTTAMHLEGHLQYTLVEKTDTITLLDITGVFQTGKAGLDWLDLFDLLYGLWIKTFFQI
uniref:Uncharacterized protein n=1 Tax=Acrobeloides nanus TaxID=290746 RepID=A0A914DW43_9BILA